MGSNVCPDGGRCEVEGMLINTGRQGVSLAPGTLGSLQMREKAGRSLETKGGKPLCFLAWCVCGLFACSAQRLLLWLEFPSKQTNRGADVLPV